MSGDISLLPPYTFVVCAGAAVLCPRLWLKDVNDLDYIASRSGIWKETFVAFWVLYNGGTEEKTRKFSVRLI